MKVSCKVTFIIYLIILYCLYRVDLRSLEDYGRALRVLQRVLNKVDEAPESDEELKTPFRYN